MQSFTNFKNDKLEQTGTLLMGATLMPVPGHPLFSSFKTESSERVGLREPLLAAGVTSLRVLGEGDGGGSGSAGFTSSLC